MRGRAALLLVVVGALGGAVVACQDEPPAKSVIVCEDQGKSCPEQTAKPGPAKGTTKILPVTPVPVDRDAATAQANDAGTDAALPPVESEDAGPPGPLQGPPGPLCNDLSDCCTSLRNAGYSNLADQCDKTSAGLNETACATDHEDYRTPSDTYEPVCF